MNVTLGAGADFVMLGGMLAGHDQCAGEIIEKDGKKFKLFYGMSSDTAMKKYVGGVAEYRWGGFHTFIRHIYGYSFWGLFTGKYMWYCRASYVQYICLCNYRASEGRTVQVPYKGDVENTIRDILGGLRSTCTYVGAAKLKELSRRTTFIRVTQQSNQMFT